MKKISMAELDKLFDDNEVDVLHYFDPDTESRPGQPIQRVNVDFPTWMVLVMDAEATRLGITRQSLIKTWIGAQADRILEERRHNGASRTRSAKKDASVAPGRKAATKRSTNR